MREHGRHRSQAYPGNRVRETLTSTALLILLLAIPHVARLPRYFAGAMSRPMAGSSSQQVRLACLRHCASSGDRVAGWSFHIGRSPGARAGGARNSPSCLGLLVRPTDARPLARR